MGDPSLRETGESDPRAAAIFVKAKKLKLRSRYTTRAFEIQKELEKQTGKKLPVNIDGAMAAIICDLGFDWRLGKAVFALGRLAGMAAHVYEEITREKPYRRFEERDVEYIGPKPKKRR